MIFTIVQLSGFPLGDGVHLVTFGFLIHMTLSEEPNSSHATLCFYAGSCEVSNTALGQGEKFVTPGSFGSFSLARGLLLPLKEEWWVISSQGRTLRTLSKFMCQDCRI